MILILIEKVIIILLPLFMKVELSNKKGESFMSISTNSIDVNYCFMNDVVEGFTYSPDYFINAQDFDDRKMGDGKGNYFAYKDPDAESRKLYETLKAIYGKKLGLEEIRQDNYCYYFESKCGDKRYSSDYIGPSTTRAFQRGIDNPTIGRAIAECRTIGGHILWPKHQGSINQSRGKAVCDRIDITLLEIKDFYESNFSDRHFLSPAIRNALVRDQDWFEQFGKFKGFCDVFLLVDSFVNEQYEVRELAKINPQEQFIPETKEEYEKFIEENIQAVKERNKKIDEFLKTF